MYMNIYIYFNMVPIKLALRVAPKGCTNTDGTSLPDACHEKALGVPVVWPQTQPKARAAGEAQPVSSVAAEPMKIDSFYTYTILLIYTYIHIYIHT